MNSYLKQTYQNSNQPEFVVNFFLNKMIDIDFDLDNKIKAMLEVDHTHALREFLKYINHDNKLMLGIYEAQK